MDKMVKTAVIALLMMATQFINAQQNPYKEEFLKMSQENHKMIDDKVEALNVELKTLELQKTEKSLSAADRKNTDNKIAQIKAANLDLQGKKKKLADLEGTLNVTNEKLSKLVADQYAEYEKNGSNVNETILKQRSILKDKVNDFEQLRYKQEADIDEIIKSLN